MALNAKLIHNHPNFFLDHFLGQDDFFNRFTKEFYSGSDSNNYPPYNVKKIDETKFSVEMALAGFKQDDISIELEDGTLKISASVKEDTEDDVIYSHRGISKRDFTRQFTLAEYVVVKNASFVDGILTVDLEREVPEEKKPRMIAINQ